MIHNFCLKEYLEILRELNKWEEKLKLSSVPSTVVPLCLVPFTSTLSLAADTPLSPVYWTSDPCSPSHDNVIAESNDDYENDFKVYINSNDK
jgi:hypothetical protein